MEVVLVAVGCDYAAFSAEVVVEVASATAIVLVVRGEGMILA